MAILVAILVIARITIGTAEGGLDIVIVPHREQRPTCKGHAKKHVENVVVCMIMLC